jgi:putative ABC transport system permease protein
MTALGLALAFLRRRWGQALLSMLVGALGIAAAESVIIAARALPESAQRAFGGVDLVIGPKGSALDLVLCCALHVSEPRGLVPLAPAMALARHPLVRAAAPIGLGDNVQGFRIVGTTPALLDIYRARIAAGGVWQKPLEAVLGAEAATRLGFKLGDHFMGAHGLAAGGEMHSEFPYTVTGILAPTGSALDRLVLTDLETILLIHRHHAAEDAAAQGLPAPAALPPAASAVLIAYRSPIAMALLPRLIDASEQFSAASAPLETARLARAARPIVTAVLALGWLFAAIAAATAAMALLSGMAARARDLALLRALGAHPWELSLIALAEAGILAAGAAVLGLALAYLFSALAAGFLAGHAGIVFAPSPNLNDALWIILGASFAALAAALVPALRAAHAPIETVLNA